MTMRTLTTILLVSALSAQHIIACCGVGPEGQTVRFGTQQNVVIYNSKTQTEYFIRNARFHSEADNIGFIAPTPTQPEITKTDRAIFSFLESKKPMELRGKGMTGSVAPASAGVEVVDVVEVAGYKATILKATDPNALTQYLKEHKYATSPELTKWTDFYIKKGWYLTAFQVINKLEMLETGVLCMKFKTDKPFNPYYVPSDNIDSPAGLSISFISDQNLGATIGGTKPYQEPRWEAQLTAQDMKRLGGFLKTPSSDLPQTAFLSQYHDNTFPNHQSDDLYFVPQSISKNLNASSGIVERGGNQNLPIAIIAGGLVTGISLVALKNFRKKPGTKSA